MIEHDDIRKGRFVAFFAYLGILILIPAIFQRHNEYTKFHIKQGLVLIISSLILYIVSFFLYFFSIGHIISSVIGLALFALQILGIINALFGKVEYLPFIGKYADKFTF